MGISSKPFGWPLLAALAAGTCIAANAPIAAQTVAPNPVSTVQVSTGQGRLVTLSRPMSDLFVADDKIADVQVRSPTQLYVFGRAPGQTTVYATSKSGAVVYSTTVRVGNNIDSVSQMLKLAMPDATIVATPMNGLLLLTGTVAAPDDAAEAERLAQAFVGETTKVLSRLRTATPLQVNLQVRVAEVSHSFVKNIGANLLTRDTTGGFLFGIASGRSPGTINVNPSATDPNTAPTTGYTFLSGPQHTTLGLAGHLLGLDVLSALDLGETDGEVTTLANPNLTALSGETATFLAGGEVPIPIAQGLGAVSVQYKQYGVSLAYTPTVLSDGRISLRVRPEVSQLDYTNAVALGGTQIPGLKTRRTETTVELGSGQSFMIAGLLSNDNNNNIEKTPGIGDLPVVGSLFRSNSFQRHETELVIVITPYLVKPVNNVSEIVLPTDGLQAPTTLGRVLLGKLESGQSGAQRPVPTMAPSATAAPAFGAAASLPAGPAPEQRPGQTDQKAAPPPAAPKKAAPAAPGFSLN